MCLTSCPCCRPPAPAHPWWHGGGEQRQWFVGTMFAFSCWGRGHPGLGAGQRAVTLLRCPALTGLETAHLTCKSKNRMCSVTSPISQVQRKLVEREDSCGWVHSLHFAFKIISTTSISSLEKLYLVDPWLNQPSSYKYFMLNCCYGCSIFDLPLNLKEILPSQMECWKVAVGKREEWISWDKKEIDIFRVLYSEGCKKLIIFCKLSKLCSQIWRV